MYPVKTGRIFFSNDELYLQGVEEGIQFANDSSALTVVGVVPSTLPGYAWMLPVSDTDEDVLVGVFDDKGEIVELVC